MQSLKWWHVAFIGVPLLLIPATWLSAQPDVTDWLISCAALVLVSISWLAFGWRSFASRRVAIAFQLLLLALLTVAVAHSPNAATLQTVLFPFVWTVAPSLPRAIWANVAVALASATGFYFAFDQNPDSFFVILMIAVLSFGMSMAIGFWIGSITDRADEVSRLLAELTEAQEEIAAMHRDSGVSSERERMARELHDTIAQSLTAIVMVTQRAKVDAASGDTAGLLERLDILEDSARHALVETRTLVAAGAPVEVHGGIVPALGRLAERFERESGVRVQVQADALPPLSRDREVVLLRCAQESLANVRKHAEARTVRMLVEDKAGDVWLTVVDDGHGFVERAASGFGIDGMRDRLSLVNGSLDVSSGSDGTRIVARIPVGVQ